MSNDEDDKPLSCDIIPMIYSSLDKLYVIKHKISKATDTIKGD